MVVSICSTFKVGWDKFFLIFWQICEYFIQLWQYFGKVVYFYPTFQCVMLCGVKIGTYFASCSMCISVFSQIVIFHNVFGRNHVLSIIMWHLVHFSVSCVFISCQDSISACCLLFFCHNIIASAIGNTTLIFELYFLVL